VDRAGGDHEPEHDPMTDDGRPRAATIEGSPPLLEDYLNLMAAYLGGSLPASEFEARFLALFLSDGAMRPESVYRALNALFLDVDAFCPDPALRGPHDLDEERLRASVAQTVATLDAVPANRR
jgi:Bacterial self-protective colicin-like immunity